MLLVSDIQQYFNTSVSSDKSGLKVADCTVQSAEYWCFYGTSKTSKYAIYIHKSFWTFYWAFYKDILHLLNLDTPQKNKINNWKKWQICTWYPRVWFMSSSGQGVFLGWKGFVVRSGFQDKGRTPLPRHHLQGDTCIFTIIFFVQSQPLNLEWWTYQTYSLLPWCLLYHWRWWQKQLGKFVAPLLYSLWRN